MSSYQGEPGGPRDPATPGPYCLARCYCGACDGYVEQQRQVAQLREQEYDARRRIDSQRPRRQPATVTTIRPDSLDERFRQFDHANPHVRARLIELVEQAVARGEKRIGIGALFEWLRWSERTETNGDPFRLNSSYRALYVRALIADRPEFADLFELRARRAS